MSCVWWSWAKLVVSNIPMDVCCFKWHMHVFWKSSEILYNNRVFCFNFKNFKTISRQFYAILNHINSVVLYNTWGLCSYTYTCSFYICVFISWRDLFQTDGIHAICMPKFLAIKLEYLQMCTNQHWRKVYGMIALKSIRYSRHKQTCVFVCADDFILLSSLYTSDRLNVRLPVVSCVKE